MQEEKEYLEEDNQQSEQISESAEPESKPATDYATMDKSSLYKSLIELAQAEDPYSIKHEFEAALHAYKEAMSEEFRAGQEKYVAEGGEAGDFVGVKNAQDEHVSDLEKLYYKTLSRVRKEREQEQYKNLQERNKLLDELKQLVEDPGDMTRRFEDWHSIQQRWREAGQIPAANRNELYNNYRHYNNQFFTQVKMSREFRELDLRKNAELKRDLIAQAQQLDTEEPGKAFRQYKVLHQRWREIGPVPAEEKDTLWNEFKACEGKLEERRQQALAENEKQKEANLEKKQELVSAMEKLVAAVQAESKGAKQAAEDAEKLFEDWKQIGFVPESDQGKTWKRFRNLRGEIFKARDLHFAKRREELSENLKRKNALCEEAEKLSTSTDWQGTAQKLKRLQQDWKKSGPVSRKHSDKLWARFRGACDAFFNARDEAWKAQESALKEQVQAREEFLKSFEGLALEGSVEEKLALINTQKEAWDKLGQVSRETKEKLDRQFSQILEKHFRSIKDEVKDDPSMLSQVNTEQLKASPGGEQKLERDRKNLKDKIRKLEVEIVQMENNLGFFGRSSGSMVQEFRDKLEKEKENLAALKKELARLPKSI